MSDHFYLPEYLNQAVDSIVKRALAASLQNPKESAFLIKYMAQCKKAQSLRNSFEKTGTHIPPFLIASVTSSCNLFCSGCYARANRSCGENLGKEELSVEQWRRIFKEASSLGVSFILLAGGEPLLRRDVVECAAAFPEILFPVFTNGTLIDDTYIRLFRKYRNLVPILSTEGDRSQTDSRRGEGTYEKIKSVSEELRRNGIFFGASITVTTENLETVSDSSFVESLRQSGCKIVFYVEYVPVTASSRSLAPGVPEREILEKRLYALRGTYPEMLFLSFPGDEKSTGGCLAASRGFFHISMDGKAEPCPFSPFSDTSMKGGSLIDALRSPLFETLNRTGFLLGEHDGGCLLFEKEQELKALLLK